MRKAVTMLVALALGLVLTAQGTAADREVTLTGKIMCAKCELKQASKCQTVIKVNEGGKEVVYWFKDKGKAEDYHEEVCGGGVKEGTVTGTVTTKDGKKWITPKKVEYVK